MMAQKHPGGRPSTYDPNTHPALAGLAAAEGKTNREIAAELGISVSTLWEWQKAHDEFSSALKDGKTQADDEVEKSLFKRAIGYEYSEEKALNVGGYLEHTTVRVHMHPDPTSCIFWLKNRRPAEWRDRIQQEVSGPNGGPMRVITAADLSDDELAEIAKGT